MQFIILPEDRQIQGNPVAKGNVHFHHNGNLHNFVLAADRQIQGIHFAKGTQIIFNASGKLGSAILAVDQKVNRHRFTEGTELLFDSDGSLCSATIGKDQRIQKIKVQKDSHVEFHANGSLHRAVLAEPQKIEGNRFAKGTEVDLDSLGKLISVLLHENQKVLEHSFYKGTKIFFDGGKLRDAMLSADQELSGIYLAGKTTAFFHDNGMLGHVTLAAGREQIIQGIRAKEGTDVSFHENGKLHTAALSNDQEIQGILCKKESGGVLFHNNGKLWIAVLAEDQTIQEHRLNQGTQIHLDLAGKLDRLYLHEDQPAQEIGGIRAHPGTFVFFHENGKPSGITLAEDQEIQGFDFKGETQILFHKNGNLKWEALATLETRLPHFEPHKVRLFVQKMEEEFQIGDGDVPTEVVDLLEKASYYLQPQDKPGLFLKIADRAADLKVDGAVRITAVNFLEKLFKNPNDDSFLLDFTVVMVKRLKSEHRSVRVSAYEILWRVLPNLTNHPELQSKLSQKLNALRENPLFFKQIRLVEKPSNPPKIAYSIPPAQRLTL